METEKSELELNELLLQGGEQYGITLNGKQLESLMHYKDILKEWNKKINLTAIEEDKDIIIKHYIDSLSIIPHLEDKKLRVIDIGTGAGFPGIPLKVAYNNLDITLFDSLEKRIKFLNIVIEQLKLDGIKTIHGRAEDFGTKQDFREKYDVAVARAVANLPVLLEYCLPFVRVGGVFIAMKGSSTGEIEVSSKALETLGGNIELVNEITLPFSDIKRNIVVIKKLRQTPAKYPRKAGKPSKEPLI